MKETVNVLLDDELGYLKETHNVDFVNTTFDVLLGDLHGFCGQKRRYIIQRISDKKYFAYEVNAYIDGLLRYNDSDCRPVTATEVTRKTEMIERVYYE